VYPTLIAAVSDAVSPVARPTAVGSYRFWRDMGYFAGGLVAGVAADAIDYTGAIRLGRRAYRGVRPLGHARHADAARADRRRAGAGCLER
jgi:hypothetical protein